MSKKFSFLEFLNKLGMIILTKNFNKLIAILTAIFQNNHTDLQMSLLN